MLNHHGVNKKGWAIEGIPRCGTCEHWAGNGEVKESEAHYEHHPCDRIFHDEEWHVSPREHDWGEDPDQCIKNITAADDAVVQDGSGYTAALKTRKSFGCVFHSDFTKEQN